MKELELKGRLDRIGKTPLEHFQDIKELELADEQLGVTVEYMFPYKCKQVEKSLKSIEIIKEKNVDCLAIKESKTLEEYNRNAWEVEHYGRYKGYKLQLTQEEFNLLKKVLE